MITEQQLKDGKVREQIFMKKNLSVIFKYLILIKGKNCIFELNVIVLEYHLKHSYVK